MLFNEIIGQHAIKERLVRTVREQRVSHAQLFAGPTGAGVLPLAVAYAQYIACENRSAEDSCGVCPACVKFAKLVHPDVHFTYPVATVRDVKKPTSIDFVQTWRESFIANPYLDLNEWYQALGIENKQGFMSVEESSDILKRLSLKTFESEYKFVIIWLAEKMRADAANKLLKMIEEPPQKTLFLLVSENPDQLLQTIRSRTQLVRVNRIDDKVMVEAVAQRHELAWNKANALVQLADNDYTQVLHLLGNDEENSIMVQDFLGWMRLCFQLKVGELVVWIEDMSKTGREHQKNFLHYSTQMVRECVIYNFADPGMMKLSKDEQAEVGRFAAFITQNNIYRFVEEFNKAYFHIERNGNPKIILMDLSIRLNRLLHSR